MDYEPGARIRATGDAKSVSAAKLLSKDEARRIAVNVAKLPELLRSVTRASFDVRYWENSGH